MSTVVVVSHGLQTTVQDLGRWGHQAEGVPVAGAMDPFAHRRANALVGNPKGAATLEVTLTGPELRFEDRRLVAVAGAGFDLFLDGVPMRAGVAVATHSGSTLRFGPRHTGARAYIAIDGGVAVPPVLGSRATHLPTNMGGLSGRALARGDRLPLGAARGAEVRLTGTTVGSGFSRTVRLTRDTTAVVRVLRGPHRDRFADGALEALTAEPYAVTVDSNRMAYRLDGCALGHSAGADIISDATAIGSLQVPASGQPMLLMADRQTTGGFATIATVISADIGVAAQAAPGDRLRFRVCDRAEALSALIAREQELLVLERETA